MKISPNLPLKHVLMGAFAGILLASGAALAQAPAGDAAPATPGKPDVKTVGDWFVRCFPIASPSPCDMFQELDDARAKQRVLAISIAYIPSLNKHALQITLPLDVALQKGLVVQTDSYTSPAMHFRRCDRGGCYVEMPVDNAMIEAMAKSGPDAKMNVWGDNGKAVSIKFSLKGFAGAHDQMVADAKAKAKPVQQPAAAPVAPAATP
jgi:invasion protein IalB